MPGQLCFFNLFDLRGVGFISCVFTTSPGPPAYPEQLTLAHHVLSKLRTDATLVADARGPGAGSMGSSGATIRGTVQMIVWLIYG